MFLIITDFTGRAWNKEDTNPGFFLKFFLMARGSLAQIFSVYKKKSDDLTIVKKLHPEVIDMAGHK